MPKAYTFVPLHDEVTVDELAAIHNFKLLSNYRYAGSTHDFWEIMYVNKGKMTIICDRQRFYVSQGHMLLVAPGIYHSIETTANVPANLFTISFTSRSDLHAIAGRVLPVPMSSDQLLHTILTEGEHLYHLPMNDFYQLQKKSPAPFGSEQLIRNYLEILLIMQSRNPDELAARQKQMQLERGGRSRYDAEIARKIAELLKDNVYGNINMNDISGILGYGKTYLASVFRKEYKDSIMHYYMCLKIEEAKQLLKNADISIGEISDMLGFSSPQYFSRRFREIARLSPLQFEKSMKINWRTPEE